MTSHSVQNLHYIQSMSTVHPLRPLLIATLTVSSVHNFVGVSFYCVVHVNRVICTVRAALAVLTDILLRTVIVIAVITISKFCRVSILYPLPANFGVCAVSAMCAVLPNPKVLYI